MKTRLLKKFRHFVRMIYKDHFLFLAKDFYGECRLVRNVWYGRNCHTETKRIVNEFKYKYRRYSRKYWTAEARMTRMLRGEKD